MKQTAVEFLVDKLKSQGLLIGEPNNLVAVRQAKEMFEQQIIDAHTIGQGGNVLFQNEEAEQYYNETFKNK